MLNALAEANDAYESGRFEQAEPVYKTAIEAGNSDFVVIHNLAVIALHNKNFDEALGLIARLSSNRSENPDIVLLHGLALLRSGQVDAALLELERAVVLSPNDSRLANTYGHALFVKEQYEEATQQFYRAAKDNAETLDYWQDLVHALSRLSADTIESDFVQALRDCLTQSEIEHKNLSLHARALIKPSLATLNQHVAAADFDGLKRWLLSHQTSENLMLMVTYIENVRCADPYMEDALTRLRSLVLSSVSALSKSPPMEMLVIIATQCFLTDYVFFETDTESELIAALEQSLQDDVNCGRPLRPNLVAMYAAYRPLRSLRGIAGSTSFDFEGIDQNVHWKKLIRMQLAEPDEENRLRASIPRLTSIENETSVAIQQQYEESPYPRWSGIKWGQGQLPIGFRQSAPTPRRSDQEREHRILIAGCGTGRNAFIYGNTQPNASITAVDLSRSSLAYAMRKKRIFGFDNIEFCHGDILRLPETERIFDEISCAGVLHHLRDPGAGLKALKSVYSGKGEFLLAVYTESGRQSVVAGIALRKEYGLDATPDGIRRFRKLVYELPEQHVVKGLLRSADFYSLHDCRDLVFNIQEHRFNLLTLSELLSDNGLAFAGIKIQSSVMELFQRMYADQNAAKDPGCWHAFEQAYPGVFGSMYHVTVRPT
ncbi:MAG: methyltransferase domain-containing protein [Rhodospirillaceae bacterium]|jgi:ubiquinone/menaquinone biosynthesis C-methylase UbiE/Flp pilus assembly protein TadD|nr:methyltransferase domain-containing protein [Rhodospirillaceae bacterium]MBT5566381.1 methyltransferase domain-containing protein [Rhodospirillaceae bacterium]MBT6088474.1 methyltransferase domain-containing protein [Rhodospirillaceae bacterium]MBT6962082.1 methyltransferase domain-containing protein [Rhodospirillaceae bacterium]MBT7451596.1 methyltransferase domain-containing protein [Rhodospirillaceae bacterium]